MLTGGAKPQMVDKRYSKPILCLDFDGVLHSYKSGWKGAAVIPDPPVPGALRFVVEARNRFRVAIFSSRSHQWGGRRAMKRWLRRWLIEEAQDNDQEPPTWWLDQIAEWSHMDPWDEAIRYAADRIVREIEWPLFKPPALISLDDRALTFDGTWPALATLGAFKPWNKKRH